MKEAGRYAGDERSVTERPTNRAKSVLEVPHCGNKPRTDGAPAS
jgi:hypothetical protein